MKISIMQENLAHAVSLVSKVIDTNSQSPILNNIFLKAQKTGVLFIGTNLETSIFWFSPAKVEKEGEILVSAKSFSELVGTLGSDKVGLTLNDSQLLVEHKNDRIKIPVFPAEDYPLKKLPDIKGKQVLQFSSKRIKEFLGKVVIAASSDDVRPVLSGVLIEKIKKRARMAATDGFRLSLIEAKGIEGELKEKVIVSAKALKELEKGLTSEGEVACFLDEKRKQIFFRQGDFVLGARLIDGKFPDFEKIIPGKGTTRVVINKEEFIRTLRSAAIFARENTNIVKLEINKEGVVLTACSNQAGEGVFKIEEAEVEGEKITASFNFRYLLEALSVIDKERVELEFSGELAPVKLTQENDDLFLHIIMPVKT